MSKNSHLVTIYDILGNFGLCPQNVFIFSLIIMLSFILITFVTIVAFSDVTQFPSSPPCAILIAPRFHFSIWIPTKVVVSKNSPAMLVWTLLCPVLAFNTYRGTAGESPVLSSVPDITVNISYPRNLKS